MSIRRKDDANNQSNVVPLSAPQAKGSDDYFHTGTGFSVTPHGAIGFSRDVEDKMMFMKISDQNNSTLQTAAPAPSQQLVAPAVGGPYSNREAFEMMNITCQSIVPQQQPSFAYTGAPHSSRYHQHHKDEQDDSDEDDDDDEDCEDAKCGKPFTMTVSRDLVNQMDNYIFTADAPNYVKNAAKLIELNDKLDVRQDDKDVEKARNILRAHSIHQAAVIWKTIEFKDEKITRKPKPQKSSLVKPVPDKDGPVPNIFKALLQLQEERGQAGDINFKTFEGIVNSLEADWRAKFTDLKGIHTPELVKFKTFKYWYDHMGSMDATSDEINHCKKNIDEFKTLMQKYQGATKELKKLESVANHPFFADPHYHPKEWQALSTRLSSKGFDKAIREAKSKIKHAQGGHAEKNKEHHEKTTTGTASSFQDYHRGYSDGVRLGTSMADWGSGSNGFDGGLSTSSSLVNTSSNMCQCGPRAIPVPVSTGIQAASAGSGKGTTTATPAAAAAACSNNYCTCEEGPLLTTQGNRGGDSNAESEALLARVQSRVRKAIALNSALHNKQHGGGKHGAVKNHHDQHPHGHAGGKGHGGGGTPKHAHKVTNINHFHGRSHAKHVGEGFWDESMNYGRHVF